VFVNKVLRRIFGTKYWEGGDNHAVGGFVICFITEQALARVMKTMRVENVLCDFSFLMGWMLFCSRYRCTAAELIQSEVQHGIA
jgi:hypothetical protein